MTLSLAEKLTAWKLEPQETAKVSMEIISLVEDLAQRLFNDYEPAEISNFYMRLDKWLSNFAEEEKQKLLLRMITHIFFVGKKEFNSLFRSAYRGSITRWIIDAANLDILNETYIENLGTALKGTWFCPLTDSFRINSFLKINSCSGHDLRPDWLSLHHLGSIDKINRYMSENGIARIVLLEDFIGSSDQVLNVVEAACSSFSAVQFLVCPMVICCTGDSAFRDLLIKFSNLKYDPVIVLNNNVKLRTVAAAEEPPLFAEVRALHNEMAAKIKCSVSDIDGYKNCGTLAVTHTNCPDNTHRMIWEKSDEWHPLFPRIKRV